MSFLQVLKEHKLFILLILIGIIIRCMGLNLLLFYDEAICFGGSATYSSWIPQSISHPPVSNCLYKLSVFFFGFSTISMRIVPFVCGIFSLYMTYLISLKIYDKTSALFSIFLMVLSFWHVLASLQVDIDGGILTFLILLFFYFLLEYKEGKRNFLLPGVILGIIWLTKFPGAMIIFLTLCIYELIETRNVKKIIVWLFPLILSSLFFLFGLLILSGIFNPEYYDKITHFAHGGYKISLRPLIYLTIWGTPLLLGLAIASLLKLNKQDILFIIWILAVVIFYMFIVGGKTKGGFAKYMMITTPFLCILGGNLISQFRFEKNILFKSSFIFLGTLITLFFLNLKPTNYLPHQPGNISHYISNAMCFKWNFQFPYTSGSGPSFWITFDSLMFIIILAAILFIIFIFFWFKKSKYTQLFLSFFISVGIAFNIFLTQNYLFNTTCPDIDKICKEVIKYCKQNNLPEPFYVSHYQKGMLLYLIDKFNIKKFSKNPTPCLDDEEFNKVKMKMTSEGGTAIIINFPGVYKEKKVWELLITKCKLLKIYKSKGIIIGYIFSCEGMKEKKKLLNNFY